MSQAIITSYPFHPVADIFPMMNQEEYDALKADISTQGQLEPIWLHDGKIIDGRNRYQACVELGVEPKMRDWNAHGSLVAFVVSLNLNRRHLSSSQKAVVALAIEPLLAEEAKERQRQAANKARELSGLAKEWADTSPAIKQNIKNAEARAEKLQSRRRLYFIQSDDRVKVGISIDIESRLKQIQTGHPQARIIAQMDWVPGLESYIGNRWAEYSAGGEWYHADDDLLKQVQKWAADPSCLVKELTKQQNSQKAANQAAAALNVNRQYVSDAKRIAADAPDILEEVRRGERTIPDAKKALQERQRAEQVAALRIVEPETCTVDDLEKLVSQGKKFGTIYVDPPWSYSNQATRSSTDNHYDTMALEEIAALPIGELAAENSHLHLWTTNAFIFDCVRLFEAWGFEYKSMLIWCKPQMGIGNYWRVSHEILLLGVRGKAPFMDRGQMSWVLADRTKHSAKPEAIRQMIEKVSPGPRLELFARRIATGWVSWGNEIARTMFDSEVEAA